MSTRKKKKRNANKLESSWTEAQRKYRLTDTQVQMARELGLNPKKLGGYANHRQEPWKRSLPEYIEELYLKRFGKAQPELVRPLKEKAR